MAAACSKVAAILALNGQHVYKQFAENSGLIENQAENVIVNPKRLQAKLVLNPRFYL
jgi:hypothetical protein